MLSIIIVNWNTKELLEQCLKSIYQSSFRHSSSRRNIGMKNDAANNNSGKSTGSFVAEFTPLNNGAPQDDRERHFEVIVVDNNSGDGSGALVKEKFPRVILIENNENLGFAKANNIGISRSKGDLFLFLNSDSVIKEDTLEKIEEKMQNRSIGLLGVKLIYSDGRFQQEFYRKFPGLAQTIFLYLPLLNRLTLKFGFLKKKFLSDVDERKSGWLKNVNIPGACLAVRREVMEKIGGWDEYFWFWLEDVDLCWRALQAGFKQYYLAEAEVLHFGGSSFALWDNFEKIYNFRKSYLKYFRKHKSRRQYFLVKWLFLGNAFMLVIFLLPLAIFSTKLRVRLKDFLRFLYEF